MGFTKLEPHIFPGYNLTNIVPVTYRDSVTFMEQLETIKAWLNKSVVPEFNKVILDAINAFQEGTASFADFQDAVNLALENNEENYGSQLSSFITDMENRINLIIAPPAPNGGMDTIPLQNAVNNAAGKTLVLKAGGVYKIDATITVPTKTVIDLNGATIDATALPPGTALAQRYAFRSAGTLGNEIALTSPLVVRDTAISGIEAGTFAKNDMFVIYNTEPGAPGLTRADRYKGELNTVQEIPAGAPTTITAATGVLWDYSATNLKIRKIVPVENVLIKNGSILMGGVGTAHNGVEFHYARGCTTKNLKVNGSEDMGVVFRSCINARAYGNDISDCTSSNTYGSTGYGVGLVDGTRDSVVKGNYFERCRHFVAGGGKWPSVHNKIHGNIGKFASSYGFEGHESCWWWDFADNESHHATHGFYFRGQYMKSTNDKAFDCTQEAFGIRAFDDVTHQNGVTITNFEGHRCRYGISGVNQRDFTASAKLYDCGTNPFRITGFDGVTIPHLEIYGSVGHAVRIEGTDTIRAKNLHIGSVKVKNAELTAVDIRYVDRVKVDSGTADNAGNYSIYMQDCTDTETHAFVGRGAGYGHGYIQGGSGHQVFGGSGKGSTNPTYADGWRVNQSNNFSIFGGEYANARWAVYTTETDGIIQIGVNARNSGSKFKNELGVGVPPTKIESLANII